jgi:hypothetical protein
MEVMKRKVTHYSRIDSPPQAIWIKFEIDASMSKQQTKNNGLSDNKRKWMRVMSYNERPDNAVR